MKVLVDTHVFLWLLEDAPQLSNHAKEAFSNPDAKIYFSAASYWEICIKQSIGKLELLDGWETIILRELKRNRIQWLAIEPEHMQDILTLPWHHRDPFDRLLIAQARQEVMSMMTADQRIAKYDVSIIW